MNDSLNDEIKVWESEGGAGLSQPGPVWPSLRGTVSQVEWAVRIKQLVNDEFDRVAAALLAIAARQKSQQRSDTDAIISILEEKRAEVMRREQAGYFIHDWQEIGDQVRQMIFHDARYQAIKSVRLTQR